MPTWLSDLLKDQVYLSVVDCSLVPVGQTVIKLPSGNGVREVSITRAEGDSDATVAGFIAALDASYIVAGSTVSTVGFAQGSGAGVINKGVNLNEKAFFRQNNLINVGIGAVIARVL